MIFNFTEKGKVVINMTKYIKRTSSLASWRRSQPYGRLRWRIICSHSEIQLKPGPYQKNRHVPFRHTTAQLLFLSMRVQHDIQPVMAFLTTRGKSPDEDNWAKVK
jgi:hypothetical protein